MSDPTTGSTSTGDILHVKFNEQSSTWAHQQPAERLTRGLIECAVGFSNEMVLTPLTDLGASILASFVGGNKQFVMMMSGGLGTWSKKGFGNDLTAVRVVLTPDPLLTKGGDPHYTGMTLTPLEVEMARQFIDKYRAKKRRENRPVRKRVTK